MVTVDETPAGSDGPSTSDVMHIGEVAARTELSLRSLRHWHEVGLLVPSGRTDGGFRLYTETDVEKILVIRRMKPLGFSLEEMTQAMRALEALRDRPDDADARAHLIAVADEARDRRTRLATQLAMADEFIDLLTEEIADT